ncbi:MAG: cytidylate kinase [Chlamydiae bacterium RIFCSPHIGHO2_12_FULL_49_9]|nr:MAG: cytidylate kinase [Chlamydiae bacterium RIFCSPHIGHO2_12_FULL_49_9]
MIIAIDGPSGTGKSTVAKGVAKRLGFTFFDTGAMYRSAAWMILQEGIDPMDVEKVQEAMGRFQYEIKTDDKGERRYFVGPSDVTEAIRSQPISQAASQVAIYPEVRRAMVKIQRKFGHAIDAVFEGRDMGTVVFPDADLKIFLTAKPEVRAKRRYRELLSKFPDLGRSITFEQILHEIQARDENDTNRSISPLKQAHDAVLIDTSDLTIEQSIEKIVRLKPCRKRRYPPMKLSYRIVYSMARFFFKTCFRLKIYGLNHFQPGAAVLAANHASFYDPPVLSISCPEEVHFLAKGSLFNIPLLGKLIRVLNSHPVERGASDAQTFRTMVQLLTTGKKLILFPEGKRSPDGRLLPIERGLGFLVQKAHCRVIPAYLSGTFEAWPPKRKFPKLFGKMACIFGTPIEWEEFEGFEKREAQELIGKKVEQSIRDLKAWYEAGAKGTPP